MNFAPNWKHVTVDNVVCHTMLHGMTATPKLSTMSYKLHKNCVHAMWTGCFEYGNMYSAT